VEVGVVEVVEGSVRCQVREGGRQQRMTRLVRTLGLCHRRGMIDGSQTRTKTRDGEYEAMDAGGRLRG